jgi:hypothetical protein
VGVADALGLVTVVDDDVSPAVSISGASVVDGDTSLTDVAPRVSLLLSAATDHDLVVDLATSSPDPVRSRWSATTTAWSSWS